MNISDLLKSRTVIKYNHIMIERKDITISNTDSGSVYNIPIYKLQELLNNGSFEDYVHVILSSESGSFGPDHDPSPLRIKKLERILSKTDYNINAVQGQNFSIKKNGERSV